MPRCSRLKNAHAVRTSRRGSSAYDRNRCEHCGDLLGPQAYRSALVREEVAQQQLHSVMLVEIKPGDGAVVRFFKTIIRGGQLAFASSLAFIVWLVTVLVG